MRAHVPVAGRAGLHGFSTETSAATASNNNAPLTLIVAASAKAAITLPPMTTISP